MKVCSGENDNECVCVSAWKESKREERDQGERENKLIKAADYLLILYLVLFLI